MSAEMLKNAPSTPAGRLPAVVGRLKERLYENISPAEIINGLKINPGQVRRDLRRRIVKLVETDGFILNSAQKEALIGRIIDDVLGYGPIEPLLRDPAVSEVMVNGPYQIFVERGGCVERVDTAFDDAEHLMNVIDKIVSPIGRRVDESSPMVDARLPDGSRVNVVIPPVALSGPTVTIRRFRAKMFTFAELVENGTIPRSVAPELEQAVASRRNILVTGGTGSGKTTLLNALSGLIPSRDRIITIEDAAELKFSQPHVVSLESRPANIEGKGRISIRDLVINALRMRPDRLVVGEVRGGEALDMLQAMNTGHDGSLTTAHANSPREAISRLETMALMGGIELPLAAVRGQIAGAFDMVIQMAREASGARRLVSVVKVGGCIDGEIAMENFYLRSAAGRQGKDK